MHLPWSTSINGVGLYRPNGQSCLMKLNFTALDGVYAIARLDPRSTIPSWAAGSGLFSVTRAEDELSIVCREDRVPDDVLADRGWTALRVDMLADLDTPGVVRSAVSPIAKAALGVFVISTHLRDYVLVKQAEIEKAQSALRAAGHSIE